MPLESEAHVRYVALRILNHLLINLTISYLEIDNR